MNSEHITEVPPAQHQKAAGISQAWKTNITLAGLALALAIPTVWSLVGDARSFTAIKDIPQLFPGFTKDYTSFVILSKAVNSQPSDENSGTNNPEASESTQAAFERTDTGWVIRGNDFDGIPADAVRIEDDILGHLAAIRRDNIHRANADDETLAGFDLTEAAGMKIQCLDANQTVMAEMILGKATSGGKFGDEFVRGYFVRRADGKAVIVYEPPAPGYWDVSANSKDYIDTKIHEFDESTITSFSIKNPKGTIAFERKDGKWSRAAGPENTGAVRQTEVDKIASRFALMHTDAYDKPLSNFSPAQLADWGLQPATWEVKAAVEGGNIYSLAIGKKLGENDNMHRALFGGNSFLHKVGDWVMASFDRDPKDYFDPPADAVEEESKPGDKKESGDKKQP